MNAPEVLAAVGLGGNVGNVAATLRAAMLAMADLPGTRLLQASRLYRTPAWGYAAQADFVNAAVLLQTRLPPRALLEALLRIERSFGRDRERGERWGPRTLDLDLLLYGDLILDEPGLQLPHPHLHERAFALLPLADIAPALDVPGRGRVADLLAAVDASGCALLPEAD